jgi:hypothetical protein
VCNVHQVEATEAIIDNEEIWIVPCEFDVYVKLRKT